MVARPLHMFEPVQATAKLAARVGDLVEAEKMSALGKLTAGVAHELNTPIGAVHSSQATLHKAVSRLRRELGDDLGNRDVERLLAVIEASAGAIRQGAERVSEVVDRLTRFSRLDSAEREVLDIEQALLDTIAVLRSELPPGARVETHLGGVRSLTCYGSRLNHVFLNVLRNASEAVRTGDTIRVMTRETDETVTIVIEDTGVGIASEQLPQIFEPHFTVRGRRVQTGFGLPTCHQVIRDHDGDIRIDSERGVGTRVTITLPR